MAQLSKTQIDRLGDRLRENPFSDSDLKALDDYRRSFIEAYEEVVRIIRGQSGFLELAGRPAKSTSSIIEKLLRENTRLSQVQDIAGCRIVVDGIQEQDRVVALLNKAIPSVSVKDRRKFPSFGYRAVHLIVRTSGKLVEVQIRTKLQHGWAELSEKYSDKKDPTIKYGGGPKEIRENLDELSDLLRGCEELEEELSNVYRNGPTNEEEKRLFCKQDYIKKEILKSLKWHKEKVL